MADKHLSDEEIQEFLDGERKRGRARKLSDLKIDAPNRETLEQYRTLYSALKKEQPLTLSPGFPDAVMAQIEAASSEDFNVRLLAALLSLLGVVMGGGVTLYFSGLATVRKFFAELLTPLNFDFQLAADFSKYFEGLNINLGLLGVAVLALAVVSLLDHLIFQSRKKINSFPG